MTLARTRQARKPDLRLSRKVPSNQEPLMPSGVFSVPEAVELGQFILAAYDLFTANDPAVFTPPDGYTLVSKVYADDLTDGLPVYKVFGFIARSGSDVVVA